MKTMKGSRFLLILATIMVFPFCQIEQNVFAQDQTSDKKVIVPMGNGNLRTAYVNIQQVIANCKEGQIEADNWQQWAQKKQGELQAMQKELKDLQERLDIQADKLTEEARFELEDTIENKSNQFQRVQQDLQKEADKRQRRLTNTIYQKALPVIKKIAEERSLDSVNFYDVNRDAYINPSLFITEDVIKAYDIAYPVTNPVQSIVK